MDTLLYNNELQLGRFAEYLLKQKLAPFGPRHSGQPLTINSWRVVRMEASRIRDVSNRHLQKEAGG